MIKFLVLVLSTAASIFCLDNGLARTPPMGWNSRQRFWCNTNCEITNECTSESLFKDMADVMSAEGYLEAGYEYIIMDSCWFANDRDENDKQQTDRERFPGGIKELANYIHSKGLKLGIYEFYGNRSEGGNFGMSNNLEKDAQTLAEWEVDYVKLTSECSENLLDSYAEFGKFLNNTGRPMVLACGYTVSAESEGSCLDHKGLMLSNNCNTWQNYQDMNDTWSDLTNIINFYAEHQDQLGPFAGPGHWNDPDLLEIGNDGLSYEQSKTQMALWAILASPLIISADLRHIKPEDKEVLLNKDVIAINQDPWGIQGRLVFTRENVLIYTRPVDPLVDETFSKAIAFFSNSTEGIPHRVTASFQEIELNTKYEYKIEDIYNSQMEVDVSNNNITVHVNPSGVVLLKATVTKKKDS